MQNISKEKIEAFFLKLNNILISVFSIILSIIMILVLLMIIFDISVFLIKEITTPPYFALGSGVFETFGLFLNALIAFEILENISSYLRKHHIQIELVLATSLTAIARKVIIFEFNKYGGFELIGLSVAVLALTTSYIAIKFLKYKTDSGKISQKTDD